MKKGMLSITDLSYPANMSKPVLLFAYGNVARGDDALGPLLQKRIKHSGISHIAGHPVIFLTDYHILVEHVTDLSGCERLLLIDADQSIDEAYRFSSVAAKQETRYTTHGMTASTLLYTYQQVYHSVAPLTSLLAIRGLSFELGDELTEQAQSNLQIAEDFILKVLSHKDFSLWDKKTG